MQHPKPLVLVAASDGRLRSIARALADDGFRVNTAHDERDLLDQAHTAPPDAIIIDTEIAPPGYVLCRMLRNFALATPILLVVPGAVTRTQEHEALRAGAWAILGTPVDTDALLLRLATFVEPKLELDRVSEECLVDRISGLYNHVGLTRRAAELAALAARHGLALACAVFRPAAQLPNHFAGDRLAVAFRRVGRASDALGRTGHNEFAVFAPASNTWAAARLVRRMTDNVEHAFGSLREGNQRVGVRAGYSAALAAHKISPPMLLARARQALQAG